MNDKAPCRPSDVINYMKIHHGVNVSYDKAWRGREIALNSIKGTLEDSYAMLSAFSDALIRNNPGIKITNTLYFNKYHTINLEIQCNSTLLYLTVFRYIYG